MSEETSLVRQSTTVIVPRTLDEVVKLSETLAKSSLLPEALRGKVPEVMMQIMAGSELGLAPMASLRSFHIIQGKPVMSADAMVAVVLSSGKCEYFRRVEESDERVTYATKRQGEPERRCTWTMDMAKQAALHQKENWRTFKRQMLAGRSKSELARDVYPDVLAGVFTYDEKTDGLSGATSPSTPPPAVQSDVIDAEFTDAQPTPPPFNTSDYQEFAELDATDSMSECQAIASRFSKRGLKPGHPAYEAINAKYKAKVSDLKRRPTSGGSSSVEVTPPVVSATQSDASTGEA